MQPGKHRRFKPQGLAAARDPDCWRKPLGAAAEVAANAGDRFSKNWRELARCEGFERCARRRRRCFCGWCGYEFGSRHLCGQNKAARERATKCSPAHSLLARDGSPACWDDPGKGGRPTSPAMVFPQPLVLPKKAFPSGTQPWRIEAGWRRSPRAPTRFSSLSHPLRGVLNDDERSENSRLGATNTRMCSTRNQCSGRNHWMQAHAFAEKLMRLHNNFPAAWHTLVTLNH